MPSIKHLIITISCILLLTSCEQVIDVDLNSASPKFVIEGNVTDGSGPHQVRITQTKNFDENNTFEGVSTAEVIITDDTGNSEVLSYSGNGIYQATELIGVAGSTYYLSVNVDGEIYTAESTMPAVVSFDSLYLEEAIVFGDTIRTPTVSYRDTPGITNFYRFLLYVNNARAQSIYIGTDEGNDSSRQERGLSYSGENAGDELESGDTLTVELQSIGEEVYNYFFTLDQTISQAAATPANPISNISGDALGYFSAHSAKTKSIVLD